jgi:hypothetical protein
VKPVLRPDDGNPLRPGRLNQRSSRLNGAAHVADVNAIRTIPTFRVEKIILGINHQQRSGTQFKAPNHGGKVRVS